MNNENMKYYEAFRTPPLNAVKTIQAGRLKGYSDINPMWRLKALTEQFGVCGVGWKYEIVSETQIPVFEGQIALSLKINIYIKIGEVWSEPIPGLGGAMLVVKERNGLYCDDDAFKKALTDAISVSFKALGGCADIYFEKDRSSKNLNTGNNEPPSNMNPTSADLQKAVTQKQCITEPQFHEIRALMGEDFMPIFNGISTKLTDLTYQQAEEILIFERKNAQERQNQNV